MLKKQKLKKTSSNENVCLCFYAKFGVYFMMQFSLSEHLNY